LVEKTFIDYQKWNLILIGSTLFLLKMSVLDSIFAFRDSILFYLALVCLILSLLLFTFGSPYIGKKEKRNMTFEEIQQQDADMKQKLSKKNKQIWCMTYELE
jgi:hypothetical protein